MGQKINPQGLRTGFHRMWTQSWFSKQAEWKNLFFYQQQLEVFFQYFFSKVAYTKITQSLKILLVDLKFYKYSSWLVVLFVFFYKMRTTRRRSLKIFKSKRKKEKITLFKENLKKKFILNYFYNTNFLSEKVSLKKSKKKKAISSKINTL